MHMNPMLILSEKMLKTIEKNYQITKEVFDDNLDYYNSMIHLILAFFLATFLSLFFQVSFSAIKEMYTAETYLIICLSFAIVALILFFITVFIILSNIKESGKRFRHAEKIMKQESAQISELKKIINQIKK